MLNDNKQKSDAQKQVGYIKEQGNLHEVAAQKTIGGDAVSLNGIQTNFQTYDIASSTEIASVKSHMSSGTELTDQDVNAYVSDFHHMLGWGRSYDNELDPIQQDAKNIMDIQEKQSAPVPIELKGANREETVEFLKHNSVLRIPDDHVETVQKALEARIRDLPENYFLSQNPTDEEVKSVVDRVKGTGLNSSQSLDQLVQTEDVQSGALKENQITQSTDNSDGKAQAPDVDSAGKSMDVPTDTATESSSESPSVNDTESDEEQYYGYGY